VATSPVGTNQSNWEKAVSVIPGLVFIIGSMVSFLTAFFTQVARPPYVHITIGVIAFFFGYLMMGGRRGGTIPPEDVELFDRDFLKRTADIVQYGVLRKLAGIPGFFRNLGIIGLPLATVAITILFCAIAVGCYVINAIYSPESARDPNVKPIIPEAFPSAILELSKLTLGAFIGSFVGKAQREPASDDLPMTQTTQPLNTEVTEQKKITTVSPPEAGS
jgi:hypothetical protein